MTVNLNEEVNNFLDELDHPLINVIERLRRVILGAHPTLAENVKWNGPNYSLNGADRITIKIHPPRQIQLISHRGVEKQAPPQDRLINDRSGLLVWKGNDRAIASFKNLDEIENKKRDLAAVIRDWIDATS